MRRWQPFRDRHASRARVHFIGRLRTAHLNLVRRERIAGLQLCAVHLHRPLKVRILVHFIRPHRRIEFKASDHRNHFLPVGHAAHPSHHRDRHARRRRKMLRPQRSPTLPANNRREKTSSTSFSLCSFLFSLCAFLFLSCDISRGAVALRGVSVLTIFTATS